MQKENTTLSVSIMSGKGGVGKTSLALNFCYALYSMQRSLMIMDCDLGLANLDVLLGISPDRNIQDLIKPDVQGSDVLMPIEPNGFDLLPAASGVPELVEMDEDLRDLLMQKLNSLFQKYHFLFLDLGAGISSTVLSFASMTHKRIVVLTPEPTSLTDSYALMKVLSTQHGLKDFHVVVNQVTSKQEGEIAFDRLSEACYKFLKFRPNLLGFIRQDKAVHEAVRKQTPLVKMSPRSKASQDIMAIAQQLDKDRQKRLPEIASRRVLGENK